jgi:hypothetical protein
MADNDRSPGHNIATALAYVECAARHDHAWRHGSEDDRRAAYTARLDAADALVAALDASGD